MDSNNKSNYAYVKYIKTLNTEEVTATGKLVQLNRPHLEGHVDLVSVKEFERLQSDFPDCIKGSVIGKDNLMNMVNYCYAEVKKTAQKLADNDSEVARRLSDFENNYEVQQDLLEPDSDSYDDALDMANKYFYFQEHVRDVEAREHTAGKTHN